MRAPSNTLRDTRPSPRSASSFLTPATADRHLSLIQRLFDLAIDWGHIDASPARGVKEFKENNQRTAWLTAEETGRLSAVCAAYALAPDGTAMLNRNTQLDFADPRAQGTESLRLAAETILSTSKGHVTYEFEGIPRYPVYRISALTGRKFAVGIKLGGSASGSGQLQALQLCSRV